ncbi:hypothetical protein MUK42_05150 [Musa troglodytarum]|uniref:Uncharacterized protein n=1 Tax=Musa troglodytarum TaxID=320322 RepID=A0A9E7GJS9_9LILI|nr:hypothetical protein MUK42_05150 [Musa troglodytarum]
MQTNESQEGCPWFPLAGRSANGAGAGAGARAKAEGSLLDAHQISKAGASTPGRKGKGAQSFSAGSSESKRQRSRGHPPQRWCDGKHLRWRRGRKQQK